MPSSKTILKVENLSIDYYILDGIIHATRGVDFTVDKGESVCLVGESGSGKSTIGLAIAFALPQNARVFSGNIFYQDIDLLKLSVREKEKYAGKEISIIFQDPAASLNPLFTIGRQMTDVIKYHLNIKDPDKILKLAGSMLDKVELPDPDRVFKSYPHELSGGMLQRVNIAIALSTSPKILVADEPTTMLDVTLQAEILDLLARLREELGLSMLFITHNLGVAAEVCDKIVVMYAGVVFEEGSVEEILLNPFHPYTIKLLECVPRTHMKVSKLRYIPGSMPDPRLSPSGCPFSDRCEKAEEICFKTPPELVEVELGHKVACHRFKGSAEDVYA